MSKAIVNALAMALAMELDVPLATGVEFAARFVEENDDLFAITAYVAAPVSFGASTPDAPNRVAPVPAAPEAGVSATNPAGVRRVAVVGTDGLTDVQRAALAANIGLCPNCQQPTNAHLPGCARASGEDPKARTKNPLPPVQ